MTRLAILFGESMCSMLCVLPLVVFRAMSRVVEIPFSPKPNRPHPEEVKLTASSEDR